jgi:hypothetical protein
VEKAEAPKADPKVAPADSKHYIEFHCGGCGAQWLMEIVSEKKPVSRCCPTCGAIFSGFISQEMGVA